MALPSSSVVLAVLLLALLSSAAEGGRELRSSKKKTVAVQTPTITVLNETSTLAELREFKAPCFFETGACQPKPRTVDQMLGWQRVHAEYLADAKSNKGAPKDVIWLGDGILFGMRTAAAFKNEAYMGTSSIYAIGGDETGHLLYRLQNGLLLHLNPRVVVVLVGTNNFSRRRGPFSGPQTFDGLQTIIHVIRSRLPRAALLLLHALPRGEPDGSSPREYAADVDSYNDLMDLSLKSLKPGSAETRVVGCENFFLDGAGRLVSTLFEFDYVLPSPLGYKALADCVREPVTAMLAVCRRLQNGCRSPVKPDAVAGLVAD